MPSSIATSASASASPRVSLAEVGIIIPTLQAAALWPQMTAALAQQGISPKQVLVIDSSSTDGTAELAERDGFSVHRIPQSEFNHGATRQLGTQQMPWAKVFLYLTQDAFPLPGAFDVLLRAFDDAEVGAAYGRQLPRPGAGPIEAHARYFNYSAHSRTLTYESRHELGIKAAFFSNNFAAYRVTALEQIGGFPTDLVIGEDVIAAAKMLMLGWKIAYVAEAQVHHSHGYSALQTLRRYFDIGVYHGREKWLRESFGEPHGEGGRFVRSELGALMPRHLHLVPYALLLTAAKMAGYQLGRYESSWSRAWCRRLSAHPGYWAGEKK